MRHLPLPVAMLLVTVIVLVRHSAYGFRFANINDATSPFFRNHVNYSAMLVCIIPVLVAFFIGSKQKKTKFLDYGGISWFLCRFVFFLCKRSLGGLIIGWFGLLADKKYDCCSMGILSPLLLRSRLFWLKNNDRYLQYANDYKTTIFHKDFGEHLIATYQLKMFLPLNVFIAG